jgi:O-antigen ligase
VKTELAWDLGPTETAGTRADRETRISDFFLFAALPLSGQSVPGLGVPVNEVAAFVLIGLCAFRHPRVGPRAPTWLPVGLVLVLALLAVSAQLNDVDGTRRLAHVVIYAGLATGRVSLLSAARGLAVSLCVAVACGAATLGSSSYPGRLTGVLADPNVAAFMLVTLGAVSVPHVQHAWLRRVMMATIVGGVLLTFSRTGLLALAFGGLWLLVGRRLRLLGGGLLVAALVWVVDTIPDDLRLLGPFSDRTGSDALRERIIGQEHEVLASAPSYGMGPGTAQVELAGQHFFFHNSYLATRAEGGWPALLLILALLAACFVLLSDGAKHGRPECAWTQAGIIGVLVTAVSLGEVLLDLPTAAVMGFAVATVLNSSRSQTGEPPRGGPG